jgi:Domain of unknown function (DUF4386)
MAANVLEPRPRHTADPEHRERQSQATVRAGVGPSSFRTTARVVGALYLAGMVVGVGGNGLIQAILGAPDHLATVPAKGMLLAVGALLILMAGVWDAAHGILMFPVLKPHGERIAFGYLGYRLVDAAFIGLWVLFLLLQIPLGREYLKAGADTASLEALSAVSVQASLYAYQIAMFFVGMAGVLLCYTFYRVQLVPRALAVWGLAGYAIHLGGAVLEVLGFNLGLLPVLPGGLWELFIGGWLIAKGFRAPAIPSGAATPAR